MINIRDLYKKKDLRSKTREKIYIKILEKCHKKIYHSSEKYIEQEYTYFTVPNILYGYPLFDKEECSKFIIKKLIENGFIVKYLGSGLIFICWKKHFKSKKKQKKITFDLDKNTEIPHKSNIPIVKKSSKGQFRSTSDIPSSTKYFL